MEAARAAFAAAHRPRRAARPPRSPTPATARRSRSPTARSAPCRPRPAPTPASGSAPPAAGSSRRSPPAGPSSSASATSGCWSRSASTSRCPTTAPHRRAAPDHHAVRAHRRRVRRDGLRGRRGARARGVVVQLRRPQHGPRPPGALDDGHVLRRGRPGPDATRRPGWCCAPTPRRCRSAPCSPASRRSTSSARARSSAPTNSTPPTPRCSTRSRASPSTRACRWPTSRARSTTSPRPCSARASSPACGRRSSRSPSPSAEPDLLCFVCRGESVGQPRAPVPDLRQQRLDRVGRLRHGQPARAAHLRHRPRGLQRVRVRHGHRPHADVPRQRRRPARRVRGRRPVHAPRSAWRPDARRRSGARPAPVARRVRRPPRRICRRPTSATRSCASASRSRTLELGADRLTGPVVLGRVLEIEELTQFKKPIRYCQVDVGDGRTAGHRLRRAQLRGRRPRRRVAARSRAARRVRHRRPEDLRPRLRRHDLLGARARPRRRPRRHHGAPARDRCARQRRPGRCSGSTTTCSTSRSPPTAATRCRSAGWPARPRPRSAVGYRDPADLAVPPAGDDGFPVTVDAADGCDRFVALTVTGLDPAAPSPTWLAPPAAPGGHAPDLAGRRRHQLRDARARPAAARLRPRHAARAGSASAGRGPGETLRTLDGTDRTLDPRRPRRHRRRRRRSRWRA